MRRETLAYETIAVLCGDLHFRHTRPSARSEADWYAVMGNYLEQLRVIADGLPILCAGDVFHRWASPPELVNWVIGHLPQPFYAIPGQHDLPWHGYDELHRSAYWTLVQAGVLRNLQPGVPQRISGALVYGFPWGSPITPPVEPATPVTGPAVAVVHQYLWTENQCYQGAPETARTDSAAVRKALRGYGAAVFGDNHSGFLTTILTGQGYGCELVNCGGFILTREDEKKRSTQVCLLQVETGGLRCRLVPYPLVTTGDLWAMDLVEGTGPATVREFVRNLGELDLDSVDFGTALRRRVAQQDVPLDVRQFLLEVLDDCAATG